MSEDDFLRRAIELAVEARAAGNMPYGSLLVGPSGEVLIEDRNTVVTDGDISAHPEFKLALWASRELSFEDARQTTMYTSTQPCEMCAGAIARSGLGRVVFALSAGAARVDRAVSAAAGLVRGPVAASTRRACRSTATTD